MPPAVAILTYMVDFFPKLVLFADFFLNIINFAENNRFFVGFSLNIIKFVRRNSKAMIGGPEGVARLGYSVAQYRAQRRSEGCSSVAQKGAA